MSESSILSEENIKLNVQFSNKDEAITAVGQMLVKAGYVDSSYVDFMHARERVCTTYIGNGLAVPHGTREALNLVKKAGIAVIQVPQGVDFGGGNVAKLIIGLAANGDNHLDILTSIAEVCSDDDQMKKLLETTRTQEVITTLTGAM
jgi:mannitol PTS system EIIA component